MKVIFLDIDGVINTDKSCHVPADYMVSAGDQTLRLCAMDPDAVKNLNKITDVTSARIVISSTWRLTFVRIGMFAELGSFLKSQGVTGTIIGHTPTPNEYSDGTTTLRNKYGILGKTRGEEISLWLKQHDGEFENFVVLDDDDEIDPVKSRWVRTFWSHGITENDAHKAIKILEGN